MDFSLGKKQTIFSKSKTSTIKFQCSTYTRIFGQPESWCPRPLVWESIFWAPRTWKGASRPRFPIIINVTNPSLRRLCFFGFGRLHVPLLRLQPATSWLTGWFSEKQSRWHLDFQWQVLAHILRRVVLLAWQAMFVYNSYVSCRVSGRRRTSQHD